MFSFSSRQKISITSRPSSPRRLQMFPISFAKVTFKPWYALPAYFTISATASFVRITGAETPA